jgi:hypothetical protein
MMMPVQAVPVVRSASPARDAGSIQPSGCNLLKKIGCGAAIAACGAVCVGSLGTACVECLAGIGASGCIDCF